MNKIQDFDKFELLRILRISSTNEKLLTERSLTINRFDRLKGLCHHPRSDLCS